MLVVTDFFLIELMTFKSWFYLHLQVHFQQKIKWNIFPSKTKSILVEDELVVISWRSMKIWFGK